MLLYCGIYSHWIKSKQKCSSINFVYRQLKIFFSLTFPDPRSMHIKWGDINIPAKTNKNFIKIVEKWLE